MYKSILKASEVEALTFIYPPDDAFAIRVGSPPARWALGLAIGWVLVAGIALTRLATLGAPESHGL